jgi:hypothetical protein
MNYVVTPRRWKCPICKTRIFDVHIDLYQQQLIQNYKEQGLNIKEVTFDKNVF